MSQPWSATKSPREVETNAFEGPRANTAVAGPGKTAFCGCDSSTPRSPLPRTRTTRPARSMNTPPPRSSANAGVAESSSIVDWATTSNEPGESGSRVVTSSQPQANTASTSTERIKTVRLSRCSLSLRTRGEGWGEGPTATTCAPLPRFPPAGSAHHASRPVSGSTRVME